MSEVLPEDAVAYTPAGKVSKVKPKPKTALLFASMSPNTVTINDALRLLSLPREVGKSNGEKIVTTNERYSSYMKRGSDSRSLESEDQIFSKPKVRG